MLEPITGKIETRFSESNVRRENFKSGVVVLVQFSNRRIKNISRDHAHPQDKLNNLLLNRSQNIELKDNKLFKDFTEIGVSKKRKKKRGSTIS